MAKKKHKKKVPVVALSDANQSIKQSLAEKARVAQALIARRQRLQEEYLAELKRREEAQKLSVEAIQSPATTKAGNKPGFIDGYAKEDIDVANA